MKTKAFCKPCNFEDEFEADELGINYYQAIGECPICDKPTVYEDGEPTKTVVMFTSIEPPNAERILITKIIEASGGDYNSIEDEILKVHNDPAHKIVLDAMESYASIKETEVHNKAVQECIETISKCRNSNHAYKSAELEKLKR